MAVIIPHPTEELKLINLQKELISDLYIEGRILIAERPLWISWDTESADLLKKHGIQAVELRDLAASENEIFIPVTITTGVGQVTSKLTLVNVHSGTEFTTAEIQLITQKKQPVRQLKIFRLGIEKELSSISKCITESKWVKLHNSAATVE